MKKKRWWNLKLVLVIIGVIFLVWAVKDGCQEAKSEDLGIKKASEYIVIPLHEPLDSAGLPLKPDSAHIITYADNGSAKAFSSRSTTYPFSDIAIDTIKDYGDTNYFFVDQIQDIDGTAGNFSLAIKVTFFCDGLPTTTHGLVQVVDDSLNKKFGDIKSKTDNLPTDPADDSDIDAQLLAIDNFIDAEIDSIMDAIFTATNDSSLIVLLLAKTDSILGITGYDVDSTLLTFLRYILNNPADYKATGFATSADGDSVIQAIADANKGNFKATGFATSSDGDSIIQAIADANKGNFKATGFATHSAADVWTVGTRDLTTFKWTIIDTDYDSATHDFSNTTIGTATNVTNDVGITQAGADKVWGTAARALTDKANFTLSSTEWEKVWYDIDTTNIDTSEIGVWFTTGISASLSDANMGAIADSVWDKDTSDAYAVAVGIGKFVKDSTGGTGTTPQAIWEYAAPRTLTSIDEDTTALDLDSYWGSLTIGTATSVTNAVPVDLDNVTGTLDATEIGTDAIGAAELAAGAVDEIAADILYVPAYKLYTSAMGYVTVYNFDNAYALPQIEAECEDALADYGAPTVGSGARTVIIYVKSDADSSGISGFQIDIKDSTGGELKGRWQTNSAGVCTFSLDDATYSIALTKTPWSITTPVYPTISSDITLTYYATAFDPGTPASGAMCRIYGWEADFQDSTLGGCKLLVRIASGAPVKSTTGRLIRLTAKSMTSDSDSGYVYMNVFRSDSLIATDGTNGVNYHIEIWDSKNKIMGEIFNYEVPDSGSHKIVW